MENILSNRFTLSLDTTPRHVFWGCSRYISFKDENKAMKAETPSLLILKGYSSAIFASVLVIERVTMFVVPKMACIVRRSKDGLYFRVSRRPTNQERKPKLPPRAASLSSSCGYSSDYPSLRYCGGMGSIQGRCS